MNHIHIKKYFFLLSAFLLFSTAGLSFHVAEAAGQTYTVCPSGCDYSTLTDALSAPGLSNDTIQPTVGYMYDENVEANPLYIPESVSLDCTPQAGIIGKSNIATLEFRPENNSSLKNCHLDNIFVNLVVDTGFSLENNIFETTVSSFIDLNQSDNTTISGNTGLGRINVRNADNATITNNIIQSIPGGDPVLLAVDGYITTPADYADPLLIPEHAVITGNTFINNVASSGGDYVQLFAGQDILFSGNTLRSDITITDSFITMLTFANIELTMEKNYFIAPEKPLNASNGTWPINLRVGNGETHATIAHNTVYFPTNSESTGGESCMGVYDDGTRNNVGVLLDITYNLCERKNSTSNATGISLNYQNGSSHITLTDSYNGFHNFTQLLYDTTSQITALNTNTLTFDPLLRQENVSTADDLYPSTISNYLDINGTEDIGAFSGIRQTTTIINPGCSIDYTSCHGTSTAILADSLRSGDTVNLAAGIYPPLAVSRALTNITMLGDGANTIFDGQNGSIGMVFSNLSNSTLKNFTVKNTSFEDTKYFFEGGTMSTSTQDYNTVPAPLYISQTCTSSVPMVGSTEITSFEGVGTSHISLFLIHVPDPGGELFITTYIPSSLASTPSELVSACGIPPTFVEAYVSNVFTLQNGQYTYNAQAVANAGIFVTPSTSTPEISKVVTSAHGVTLTNSSNNTFENISITNNSVGVSLEGNSDGNTFLNTAFHANTASDVASTSSGINKITNSLFDISKIHVTNSGKVQLWFTALARVMSNSGNTPLPGVQVTFKNAQNIPLATLTTDNTGYTPETAPLLATELTSTSVTSPTAGGYNPFNISASLAQYTSASTTGSLIAKQQEYTVLLSPIPAGTSSSGGSGGGYSTIPSCTINCHPTSESGGTILEFPGYKDLSLKDKDRDAFAYVYKKGIMTGNPDGTVRPDSALQRDEVAKLVEEMLFLYNPEVNYCNGTAPFPDVELSNWAARYICLGKQEEIITGYKSGSEKGLYIPGRTINRVEFLAILLRAMKYTPLSVSPNYGDVRADAWYAPFAKFAFDYELFPKIQLLYPDQKITRREAARIIYTLHLKQML